MFLRIVFRDASQKQLQNLNGNLNKHFLVLLLSFRPGNYKSDGGGALRLKNLDFLLDGHSIKRHYTSYQSDAENGFVKFAYNNLFDSLGAYYSSRSPQITLREFIGWSPIFGCSLIPSGKLFKNEVPLVKAGKCSLLIEFSEATPTDLLQEVIVIALYPGLVTIDSKRTVLCSFRAG